MKSFFQFLYTAIPILMGNQIKIIKPNFCADCKHFRYNFFTGKQFGKCELFPIIEEKDRYYLVNGQNEKKNTDYHFCSIARGDYKDMCGPEGKFFEQK